MLEIYHSGLGPSISDFLIYDMHMSVFTGSMLNFSNANTFMGKSKREHTDTHGEM